MEGSQKMRGKWFCLVGTALFLFAFQPDHIFAENQSLQELIDQTPSNGTLHLKDETYTGNVIISKPLTIIGSKNTHIRGDGKGNVILIKEPGHGVVLDTLRISHSSKSRNSEEEYSAIKVLSDRNVLRNLTISDSFHGIYLSFADENEISKVRISGMGGGEIGGQGNGIQLIKSHRNTLSDTDISHSRDGIYFYYANNNVVKKVNVTHTRYGLHYMYSDDNHFYNNHFSLNVGGAAIMHSKRIELIGNEFSYHQGGRAFGLMLQSSDENIVKDNQFIHNQRGLYLDLAQRNKITSNKFQANRIGVELWASSGGQVFSLNRFFRNTLPVITIGGQSNNMWSEDSKGNLWGETLPLFDLNQDQVGDIPVQYQSSLAKLIEDQELVHLFFASPSIFIYEKLNQFLHRQETVFVDNYPLTSDRKVSLHLEWILPLLVIPLLVILRMTYGKRREFS
jgi:nitrous oxidase accessory protein